jgi:thiamine biosynthesis protein ThiS
MNILVNGENREVPGGLTVSGLLGHLGIHPGQVAIERNLEILFRTQWETTLVQPSDRYEIVHMVGGG